MCAVLVEMETPMCGKLRRQPPFPFLPVDHVKVPGQHMDVKMASSHQECMEKFTETVRISVRFPIDQHADPAVEIPAEDDDAVVSLDRGCAKCLEIGISIDEKRRPLCANDAPTVASDHKQRRGGGPRPSGHASGLSLQFRLLLLFSDNVHRAVRGKRANRVPLTLWNM